MIRPCVKHGFPYVFLQKIAILTIFQQVFEVVSFSAQPDSGRGCSRLLPGGLPRLLASSFHRLEALRSLRTDLFAPQNGAAPQASASATSRPPLRSALEACQRRSDGHGHLPLVPSWRSLLHANRLELEFMPEAC